MALWLMWPTCFFSPCTGHTCVVCHKMLDHDGMSENGSILPQVPTHQCFSKVVVECSPFVMSQRKNILNDLVNPDPDPDSLLNLPTWKKKAKKNLSWPQSFHWLYSGRVRGPQQWAVRWGSRAAGEESQEQSGGVQHLGGRGGPKSPQMFLQDV